MSEPPMATRYKVAPSPSCQATRYSPQPGVAPPVAPTSFAGDAARSLPTVAIAYRLDPLLGLTLVVWDGVVTGHDAEEQVRRLRADPDWPPGPRHVLDVTSVRSVPTVADTKLIDMMAEMAEMREIRFAVIASDAFDEATRFQEAASAVGVSRVIVFNELSTACTWLGIDLAATRTALSALRNELREQRRHELREPE